MRTLRRFSRAYVISYNPPSGVRGVAQNAVDYLSSFWRNVESVVSGASRGANDDVNLIPQPGFDVTLLANQPVHFAWEGTSAKKFIISDANGKKIFQRPISNGNSLDVTPSEAKLKAGQKYSWTVDNSTGYKFTVLDEQTERDILVSDLYPDAVDLYWLSAQWLTEISPTDGQLREARGVIANVRGTLMTKCRRSP